MSVYRVEMLVAATAYIRADSEEEARQKADALKGQIVKLASAEIEVSDTSFDDTDLPDVSMSPVGICQGPDPDFSPDIVFVGD